ncbi:MAG: glycine cleavage system protein R [Sphingomonadales bacterium]
MPPIETHSILIAITAPDRVGLISTITARLFDLGINLADTSFAVLGSGCEFTCVAQAPVEVSVKDVKNELVELDVLKGADISVSAYRYQPGHAESARVTHRISVGGGDRPGLIARLSEVFVEFDANVVRMNSTRNELKSGEAVYRTCFDISIPEARAASCLAAVSNTAGQLNLDCSCQRLQEE